MEGTGRGSELKHRLSLILQICLYSGMSVRTRVILSVQGSIPNVLFIILSLHESVLLQQKLHENTKESLSRSACLCLTRFWRHYGSLSRHLMALKLQHYTKFLFVRDPFVRLISAFRNKFRKWVSTGEWLERERALVHHLKAEECASVMIDHPSVAHEL